jgi:hypothetical protein
VPAVPLLPGVPSLASYTPAVNAVLLTADAISLLSGLFGPQWGIFQNGALVIDPESVVSFDYKQEYTISDYPLEQGAFESYDRVLLPFESRLTLSSGGSIVDRAALIAQIQTLSTGVNIYDVVTPEAVYPSVSVHHYDYRRTADNAGRLQIDVWLTQIRVTTSTQFTNTQAPNGASPQGAGSVQTTPATSAQQGALGGIT